MCRQEGFGIYEVAHKPQICGIAHKGDRTCGKPHGSTIQWNSSLPTPSTEEGFGYVREDENPSHLDFLLDNGIEIEVKRMHSDRIAAQMARAPNVIAAQGEEAVRFLASLLRKAG